jgi:hypothetical protein
MVSEAIASGDIQAINYFIANNYVGALKELAAAPNQKVLMLPVDAAGIIGAIGGIAEITREAFGGGNAPDAKGNGDKPRRSGPAGRGSVPSVSST